MAAVPVSHKHQVYRLALYGVRGSGKTCILAALSLPRVPHPKGFSCSWIEQVPGHPFPTGEPNEWTTDDPFHAGWKWLNEQRSRLKRGELPEPTPPREEPMRFRFDFGSRDQGTRHIELIDYSGELLTKTASELATVLRGHMQVCDGLLVLAEVPYPGRDHAPLAEDLEKLKSAFLLLLNGRDASPMQEWPIALLFNKWDRRGESDRDETIDEQRLIEAFLKQTPPPPQSSLVDTITNAVGEENSHCFPVSAFGAHQILDDGKEVPRLNGTLLKSQGLEDGFVWVADRCDQLRVEHLEEAAAQTSWWAFPQMILGRSAVDVRPATSSWTTWIRGVSAVFAISTAWSLRTRFPKKSPLGIRTIGAMRKLACKLICQVVLGSFIILAILLGLETTFDGIKYRGVLATRNDPMATAEQLSLDEAWLEAYFISPDFRHSLSSQMILDRKEAHSLLVTFRNRRDEELWKTVTDAETQNTRVSQASAYLAAFPAGLHQADATTIVKNAEGEKWERENADYLSGIELEIESIKVNPETRLEELIGLNERIGKLPHPDSSSALLETLQNQLRERINQKQSQVVEARRQADWGKFKQDYFALMQKKMIIEAARELESRVPKDSNLKDLISDFATLAPKIIREKVQEAIKNRSWQLARNFAKLSSDQNVVKLLPPSTIKDLGQLTRDVNIEEDKHLYSQIVRLKPQCGDQINEYLSHAPLKAMEREVENYRKYLNTMNQSLDLKLRLTTIQWHNRYYSHIYTYKNDVTVLVRGRPTITATDVRSKANTRSDIDESGQVNVRLNETITIDVSVVARYGALYNSTMSGGAGTWTGTPNQLRSGITIDLNGDGFTNKAFFSLAGIPIEPDLPEWQQR